MAKLGDIEYYRGDSYPIELTIKNNGTQEVIDITGFSFILTVDSLREPRDETTQIFTTTGIIDADPSTGKVSFTLSSSQTNLSSKTYYYDIQMIDTDGNIRTIAKNQLQILQDITKT